MRRRNASGDEVYWCLCKPPARLHPCKLLGLTSELLEILSAVTDWGMKLKVGPPPTATHKPLRLWVARILHEFPNAGLSGSYCCPTYERVLEHATFLSKTWSWDLGSCLYQLEGLWSPCMLSKEQGQNGAKWSVLSIVSLLSVVGGVLVAFVKVPGKLPWTTCTSRLQLRSTLFFNGLRVMVPCYAWTRVYTSCDMEEHWTTCWSLSCVSLERIPGMPSPPSLRSNYG